MSVTHLQPFSTSIPPKFGAGYKTRKVIKYLRDQGFERVPSNGGHQQYKHAPSGIKIPVPVHGGGEINDKLLSQLARELSMTPKEFRRQLDRYA